LLLSLLKAQRGRHSHDDTIPGCGVVFPETPHPAVASHTEKYLRFGFTASTGKSSNNPEISGITSINQFIKRNKQERASWPARSLVRWWRGQLQRIATKNLVLASWDGKQVLERCWSGGGCGVGCIVPSEHVLPDRTPTFRR
jgi:hypothetical protein